jgi:hypothetical protein
MTWSRPLKNNVRLATSPRTGPSYRAELEKAPPARLKRFSCDAGSVVQQQVELLC